MLATWAALSAPLGHAFFVSRHGVSSASCRVEAGVHLLVVLVDVEELGEQLVVDRAVVRVRAGRSSAISMRSGMSSKRRWPSATEARRRRRGRWPGPGLRPARMRAVEDVGVDLAPEAGLGAAADEVDVVQPPLDEPLDVLVHPAGVVGATPSKTARIRCARVVVSDWLKKPPRTRWFSTGVRSPLSQGVKISLPLPGGMRAASRLNAVEDVVGRGRRPRARRRARRAVAQHGEAAAGGVLLGGDQVAARDAGRQRCDAVDDVGLLERHVAGEPRRRADVEVRLEVPHRARADGRRLRVRRCPSRPGRPRAARARAAISGVIGPRTAPVGLSSGSFSRSTPAIAISLSS